LLAYRQFLVNSNKIPVDKNLQQYSIACLIKVFNFWLEDHETRQFKAPKVSPMPTIKQASVPNTVSLSAKIKEAVLNRDGYVCQDCGITANSDSGPTMHVDHIVPRSRGGSNDMSNLQCLCSTCNNMKSDN